MRRPTILSLLAVLISRSLAYLHVNLQQPLRAHTEASSLNPIGIDPAATLSRKVVPPAKSSREVNSRVKNLYDAGEAEVKDMEHSPLALPSLEDEQTFEQVFSQMEALAHDARKKSPMHEEIALRAYQIFLQRGGLHGQDLEDWFEAEWQLLAERR